MKAVQTEGCLNVPWSFPIILICECFHNNISCLKWLKLSTLLIFKMVSKRCFVLFRISAFISYIFVSVSPFKWRIYTIDVCWYRQLIPLMHAQNTHVSLLSAVVCAVFSSAAFWSDAADARRQHHWLSSLLIPSSGPCQLWPPNNPHPLNWLYHSLSSPPVAGVWWVHWHRCTVAAVTSSKWMLHTGGGLRRDPPT